MVESRRGAPALGVGSSCSRRLSPSAGASFHAFTVFPLPAHQTGRAVLILSALYGPLHPKSSIQNYNLKMSDSPAYKTWKKRFAPFLRCYVLSNGIREIYFFLGKSTHYLKVAEPAAKSLLEENLIDKAIQYCVVKGNSRKTPTTHGKLLEKHLKEGQTDELPENIKPCPIEKCP